MRLQEEFLCRGRFAPWHRLRGWLLVLHCAADCPWRRRYAQNCPRPLRIDSIGLRVRPRGQFAVVCHLAIVSAASLRFRRQHPRLINLVETERARRHWRHSEALKMQVRTLSAYFHPMASVLPSRHSSCIQFSVPSRIECRQVTPCRASSASGTKAGTTSKTFLKLRGVEFLFLSQRARRAAFGGSIAPKAPVLKLNRPFARKPPATTASESTRAAFMLVEKPQVAALRRPRAK